jgi:hypothetical protein
MLGGAWIQATRDFLDDVMKMGKIDVVVAVAVSVRALPPAWRL